MTCLFCRWWHAMFADVMWNRPEPPAHDCMLHDHGASREEDAG